MAWEDLARSSIRSAQRLIDSGVDDDLRSCVSRAYYAVYAAVTPKLSVADFPHGWHNPGHNQIADLVNSAAAIPVSRRKQVSTKLRLMRQFREDADYRPGATIDREIAVAVMKEARAILAVLEVTS